MSLFIIVLHIIVCFALIMIVLLQTGKGADMGAAFGGGSGNTLFGATGASTFLSKMTTVAAVVFMLTSLTLAYRASKNTGRSILTDQTVEQTETAPAPAESTTTETAPANEATTEKKPDVEAPKPDTTSGTKPETAPTQQEESPKSDQ